MVRLEPREEMNAYRNMQERARAAAEDSAEDAARYTEMALVVADAGDTQDAEAFQRLAWFAVWTADWWKRREAYYGRMANGEHPEEYECGAAETDPLVDRIRWAHEGEILALYDAERHRRKQAVEQRERPGAAGPWERLIASAEACAAACAKQKDRLLRKASREERAQVEQEIRADHEALKRIGGG